MALSYKARRRWSIIILLIGLPLYIAACVFCVDLLYNYFDRPPLILEFLIYVALGVIWVIPLKFVFLGVGKDDPDQNS